MFLTSMVLSASLWLAYITVLCSILLNCTSSTWALQIFPFFGQNFKRVIDIAFIFLRKAIIHR